MPHGVRGAAPRAGALCAAGLIAWAPASDARVTRIVIDSVGAIGAQPLYEDLIGRAFGELDPNDAHNKLITDIALAPRNSNGKVEYVSSEPAGAVRVVDTLATHEAGQPAGGKEWTRGRK